VKRDWPEHYEGADTAPEYYDDAVARGHTKLAEIRAGGVPMPPVGFLKGRIVLAVIFGVLPALAILYGAEQVRRQRDGLPLAVFLAVLAALFLLAAAMVIVSARPGTPKRALRLFYRAIARGKGRLARRLSVPNDFDTFPRYQPVLHGLGGSEAPFQFAETREFKHYWDSLVRYPSLPYCLPYVRNVKLERLAEDVVLATFDFTVVMNTQVWFLLLFLGLLPVAVIGDLATRKTAGAFMSKLLVRTPDGEWRIFNAEWQGLEEEEPAWL